MSRIGNAPVAIPKGVNVSTQGRTISAKGPQGTLSFEVPPAITFKVEGNQITFTRPNDQQQSRAMHGMARAQTANIIRGVSEGYKRELEIVGVGYRAAAKGKALDLTLGFSHPVSYPLPEGVKAEVTKEGRVILSGADKAVLGQAAADIRGYRPPEPYKGKGVRYADENVIRKEGKRGKK